jgi:hypothetical protein
MITVERISEENDGKTIRRTYLFSDEGLEYVRIEFTDGSHMDFDQKEEIVLEDPACEVCNEADRNVVKDPRNRAVITIASFVAPAFGIRRTPGNTKTLTFAEIDEAVRAECTKILDAERQRKEQAKKRAVAARAEKKEPKQNKYFDAGNKEGNQ